MKGDEGRYSEEGGRLLELERTVAAQGARMDAFMERMLRREQDGRLGTPEEGRPLLLFSLLSSSSATTVSLVALLLPATPTLLLSSI